MAMDKDSFGGFSIIRDLAGGGMMHLYVARDASDNRVVIRTPKEEYRKDRHIRKYFLKNAEILSQFRHPNIIRVLHFSKDGGVPYMLLEYVEAKNLRDMILYREALLTDNPLSLIRQLASAIYYLHSCNWIHLDIKPENILIRSDGLLTLIDFDLIMPRKNKPQKVKQIPGTPSYVAPEVFLKHLVDERADIYALGTTCYEMLCHHKPFEGKTPEVSRQMQLDPRVRPAPMKQYNPAVPPRMESIILKCLAKNPDERYPSMSLIIKDLESLI